MRKIYATLFKENDTFLGWEIGKGYTHYCHNHIFALHVLYIAIYIYNLYLYFLFLPRTSIDSPHNCQVMQTLIKEVTGLNPSFESSDVRGTTNIILRHYVVIKLQLSIIICRGCI